MIEPQELHDPERVDDRRPTLPTSILLARMFSAMAARSRLWATLVLSAALYGWAVAAPAPAPHWSVMCWRLVGATLFTLIITAPTWWRDRGER